MSRETRERVAQCEEAITQLQRRLESLEARSPGHYTPEPQNPVKIEGRGYSRKFETVDGDLVLTEEHIYAGTGFPPPVYPPGYPYPFGGTTDEED